MKQFEVPVLIVGGGPVGLYASHLLASSGVESRVIERRSALHTLPQAHVINARTMELCRTTGIGEAAMRDAATGDMQAVLWVVSMAGQQLGRLAMTADAERIQQLLAATPTPPANVSQHVFEPILAAAVERAEGATLHFDHQWESMVQDDEGVTSRVTDRKSGEVHEVRSRWLLAADGAGSRVRKQLGIEMIGPAALASFIMIHFEADLSDVVRQRGFLYWVFEPGAEGVFIAHEIEKTWVFMRAYQPAQESPADFSEARCMQLLRAAIGDANAELRIRAIGDWTMSAQVAESYSNGRVFLLGDAAHRFPPTGGIGMNTGVQDAHNLAWKLAAVESSRAGAPLLDSYDEERRAVARSNTDQSLKNAVRMSEVNQAIGVTGDAEQLRKNFAKLRDEPERAARVQAAVDDQMDHFDMLGLDLGFGYEAGAVIPDGTPPPHRENPTRDYVPSTRPGARLPHAGVVRDGELVSTLDLIDYERFTLLVGAAGKAWADAVAALSDTSLTCITIGPDAPVQDPSGRWAALREVDEDGAVLVRPDGHVAWRSRGAHDDPAALLSGVLSRLLGH